MKNPAMTVWNAWRALAKLRTISKKLTQITKAEKEKKNKDIEEELEEAIQKGDAAQIWNLSKKRSGRNIGPKLRGRMSDVQMSEKDWYDGLSREGKHGGCMATKVEWQQWHIDVQIHLGMMIPTQTMTSTQPMMIDTANLCSNFVDSASRQYDQKTNDNDNDDDERKEEKGERNLEKSADVSSSKSSEEEMGHAVKNICRSGIARRSQTHYVCHSWVQSPVRIQPTGEVTELYAQEESAEDFNNDTLGVALRSEQSRVALALQHHASSREPQEFITGPYTSHKVLPDDLQMDRQRLGAGGLFGSPFVAKRVDGSHDPAQKEEEESEDDSASSETESDGEKKTHGSRNLGKLEGRNLVQSLADTERKARCRHSEVLEKARKKERAKECKLGHDNEIATEEDEQKKLNNRGRAC